MNKDINRTLMALVKEAEHETTELVLRGGGDAR